MDTVDRVTFCWPRGRGGHPAHPPGPHWNRPVSGGGGGGPASQACQEGLSGPGPVGPGACPRMDPSVSCFSALYLLLLVDPCCCISNSECLASVADHVRNVQHAGHVRPCRRCCRTTRLVLPRVLCWILAMVSPIPSPLIRWVCTLLVIWGALFTSELDAFCVC